MYGKFCTYSITESKGSLLVGSNRAVIDGLVICSVQARSWPFSSSPALTASRAGGRKKSCVISSSRVQINFTGAPTAFDASTAAGMKSTSRRRPNPPPSRVVWTLTWSGFSPAAFGRRRLRHLLDLGADINVASICFHVGRTVHRLHGRVRHQRQLVNGRERLWPPP